eukprot:4504586-Alexandrium_andersonii.AAC.1
MARAIPISRSGETVAFCGSLGYCDHAAALECLAMRCTLHLSFAPPSNFSADPDVSDLLCVV